MARIESPFEKFPGFVEIPDWLTAVQVDEWLERSRTMPDAIKTGHSAFRELYTRWPLFTAVSLQVVNGDGKPKPLEIDPATKDYPSAIAFWLTEVTNELINEAINEKN